ncbi:2-hydroxyacyl-CoA dehydratase family protein [Povalibacter sp.]|uniref:2-hydroxyacyl-CoA dehydratase family protein n=1 Tax=Povalibacter sp. TaxID=1962978 RepID=UPI002F3E5DC8
MDDPSAILGGFRDAFDDAASVADRLRRQGRSVARVIGSDIPRELLLAAGIAPVRLAQLRDLPTPLADRAIGSASWSTRTLSLLEQLLTLRPDERVVISHAEAELPQLFAVLRELVAAGELQLGAVHLIDLKHLPRESTRNYNASRLRQLQQALGVVSFASSEATLARVIAAGNEQRRLLRQVMKLRLGAQVRLSGVDALKIIGSAAILPVDEHVALLRSLSEAAAVLPILRGTRAFLTGSVHEHAGWYALLESCGVLVMGEDHDWGEPSCAYEIAPGPDPLRALAEPALRATAVSRSIEQHGASLRATLERCRPDVVIELCLPGDEASPWHSQRTWRLCADLGLPLLSLGGVAATDREWVSESVRAFVTSRRTSIALPSQPIAAATAGGGRAGTRSRKSLRSLAAIGDYQRQWFDELRQRALAGEAIAVVNANAPQEILRALDIPFVVNQWWSSIVAAKQQSSRYLELLEARGYPTAVDAYSAQGLAAAFDDDPEKAPWGGLPRPQFLQALNSTDSAATLFEAWSAATGADLYIFERTVDPRWNLFSDWWQRLPDHWDEALEPERLDLLVTEMRELIARLEQGTGREFSLSRFADVMNLVNEQEDLYRRTRDLIARTIPAPVSVVDTMPATMTPQWQRGTVWARDAARAFHDEVVERVAAREAACPNERIRLMWVGRGMWSDMGFYQRWEATHGAVFVWSMYLALAADGYIRRFDGGRDPLRALAARVVTMGDELRMPTWAAAWHVHEAQTHSVDGAVALSDADPFVLRALERAGIPVVSLPLDNFNQEGVDRDAIVRSVTEFIEGPAASYAARRR